MQPRSRFDQFCSEKSCIRLMQVDAEFQERVRNQAVGYQERLFKEHIGDPVAFSALEIAATPLDVLMDSRTFLARYRRWRRK
jgi:hypothetical protein